MTKKFFAWLLSVVMVLSLMPNNYTTIVAQAEETTGISMSEIIATDDGSIPTLSAGSQEELTAETAKTVVAAPDNDLEATVYRLTVPGNTAVALKAKYIGSENTEYTDYTYIQVFDADNKITECTAHDYDAAADGYFTEGYCSFVNNSSEEAVYAVCVQCNMDTELTVEASVPYTEAIPVEIDNITFAGDRVCYEYPVISDWDTYATEKDSEYGYLYSVTIPEGKAYKLSATYSGTGDQYGYSMAIYREWFYNDNQTINFESISGTPWDSSVCLYGGNTYYLATDDSRNQDWSLVNFTATEVSNISSIDDSNITPITGNGEVEGTITDTEYVYSSSETGKGALFSVTLNSGTGYSIYYEESFYIYTADKLGIESFNSGYDSTVSLFNSDKDPVTYFIWAREAYDENGDAIPATLQVNSVNLVANSPSTHITELGSEIYPPLGNTQSVYLNKWEDEYGNEEVSSNTTTGTIYSIEVPAYSKYVAKLEYLGEADEYGNIAAYCYIVDEESVQIDYMSVSSYYDSMQNSYNNLNSVSIDNSNNSESVTYYFVISGNYTENDIKFTVDVYPNIANITDKARDVTDLSTYDITISDVAYEFVSDEYGYVETAYGELVKVVLNPGENKYYDTPSDGVALYEADGEQLSFIGHWYNDCISVYNDSTDEVKTYYMWIRYWDQYAEAGQLVQLDDSMAIANVTTKNLPVDGSVNEINVVNDTAIYYKYVPVGNGIDAGCGKVTGDFYKVEVPAGEKYVMQVDYTGSDVYTDMPTKSLAGYIFDESSKKETELYVNNWKNEAEYVDNTTKRYTFDNQYGDTAKTFYVAFCTDDAQAFQYSVFEYPNINSLVASAEDITEMASYTGDFTDYSYEFVWGDNGSTGDYRGGLVKLTVKSGERVYYSLIDAEQAVIYKLIDGELVYQSSRYGAFDISNTANADEEYYVWVFTYMDSYETYTISQTQNINTLKDSAVLITGVGSYTGEVSGDSYLTNNSGASSVGTLFKITLEPGQQYMIEGKDRYGNSYTGYQYTEGGLGKVIYHVHWGSPYVISNFNDTTTTYYIWHSTYNTDEYGQYPDIVLNVSEINDVQETVAAKIPVDGTQTTVTPNPVNVAIKQLNTNYDTGETYYISNVVNGTLYYVDIPANSDYNICFDYTGEPTTGWLDAVNSYYTEELLSNCVIYEDGLTPYRLQVSKFSDMPNYNTNGTGKFSESYFVSNDTDTTKRYYMLVQNDIFGSQVALSVKQPESIDVLVEDALNITAYNTYEGEFSTEMYSCPTSDGGKTISRGKLAKVTLGAGQAVDLFMGGNTNANVYELVDGKLVYSSTILTFENILYNESDKEKTFYLWFNCGYTELQYYYIITRECNAKSLKDLENNVEALSEGKNVLANADAISVLYKNRIYYDMDLYKETYMVGDASVYKFDIPARSTATFTLNYSETEYTSGPRIYRSFDSEYYTELFYNGYEGYGYKEYSISNLSDEVQTVCIYHPYYYMDCTIDISVDSFTDGLVIYSWNDEVSARIIGVLEAHPEYKDKVHCVNFDMSGTGVEYIDTIKSLLESEKDNSALIVMDIDIIGKLKSSSGFANLEDIGFDTAAYDNAYDYNIEMGTYNDKLKFVTSEAYPGGFIYNEKIALEVLGTKDPVEVQKLIESPEKFLAVAQQMKDAGYYMTSGEDALANLGRYTFNEDESKKFCQSIAAGGYSTGNGSWSVEWYNDMVSGEVFGFFASPWYVYWTYQFTDEIPVSMCEGPIYYPWGGSFIGVASDGNNGEKDELAAEFLELLCCDEEVMYTNTSAYVSSTNGGVILPNNKNVVERLIADSKSNPELTDTSKINPDVKLGNNPLPVWHNAAKRIGKGEWESKCTDRKYIITVDSSKEINLKPGTTTGDALKDAGFVYDNFTKVSDENGNAAFNPDTGVLKVNDLEKVVKYIYTENGVSRELQFIACKANDTAVKVEEEVVVDTEKGETTTTFIEVDAVYGEIVGQIDEVEVETNDAGTTIVVTENKDALGEIVKDASITVSQETISEDTLNQSIEVAESKNESYAQAADDNEAIETKVEIKEIKAEFKDDTANTEVSKELINKLQDKDMSLEISKKNDRDEVEYSWHFDRDSMKHADKEEIIPVNTKVTIHTDDELSGYDQAKKEKIDQLTGRAESQADTDTAVVAFDHNGKLPGKTTVTVNVGGKYPEGTYVYYYHYDESDRDNPRLVPKGRGKVKDGYLPVRIDHCSDYVMTTSILVQATGATLSTAEGELDGTYEMETGDELKLNCTVAPADAMQDVTYSSSDERVLTVDDYGNVKAVAAGTATIKATVNDDSGVFVEVTITVKASELLVTEINLDQTELELEIGDTATLQAEVLPENATNKTLIWTSDYEDVATVDANGKITALAEGETLITVTATDGSGVSAECLVTVVKAPVAVEELKLDVKSKELKEGEEVTFTVTVSPEDASNKVVTWSSSDDAVAKVDANGKVTAIKAGTATITATAADGSGKTVSVKITVKPEVIKVSKINLDKASLSLEEGATAALVATVRPGDATDKAVTWKSSNIAVATVDASGNVTAIAEGTATITVTASDGSGVKASCKVTVAKKVVYATEVTISNSSLSLEEGDTATLTAKVAPDSASNKSVNWSSNDTSVATVDANGKVTALKAGIATITAAAADGSGKTATCKVTITEPTPVAVDVLYHTHIQNYGDSQGTKKNGEMAGTKGESKRLESIWVEIHGNDNLGIQYTTHCQSYGWMPWSADGEVNGTSGESKRLEAIMIQLTGEDADKYDVYYRVHAQNYGWLGWAKNGEPSGTSGESKRLEGIQIVVVPRGESFDKNMEGYESATVEPYKSSGGNSPILGAESTDADKPVVPGADEPFVIYQTHVQTYGWQQWVVNGAMSGTSGESKRLEGINIKVSNMPYDGDIVYTTHVQTYGWQGVLEDQSTWKKNGEMSGTSGESKRLEAICINLTGEMAEHYDIYYRVHAQNFGWLGWACNGEEAGTAGHSKRLEGIQIILVPKGEAGPGISYNGISSDMVDPFVERK